MWMSKFVHTSHYECKMLVSLAKLLNESLFYNKLERFSIMNKNYAYSMKQPSLMCVSFAIDAAFQSVH